jgi:hypothetical protein
MIVKKVLTRRTRHTAATNACLPTPRCRINPYLDQGGACGAAGSASAPDSALGRPARRTPSHNPAARRSRLVIRHADSAQPSSSPPIVRLAATASMAAQWAVARDRLTPTIDTATTHPGSAPTRTTEGTRQ